MKAKATRATAHDAWLTRVRRMQRDAHSLHDVLAALLDPIGAGITPDRLAVDLDDLSRSLGAGLGELARGLRS